jgi:CDP-glucose 4,6-dehydratase
MPEQGNSETPLASAFGGKRVLLTGHTGFKGGWLALWLERLGAQVVGIALPPPEGPSFYAAARVDRAIDSRIADIRDPEALARVARDVDAEILFHLAAQPIVRRSHRAPAETFATNVSGTAHVLDIARAMPSLRAAVIVTSDKCYRNNEWPWPYREGDALGGKDPYSASKACTELVADSYRATYFDHPDAPRIATARAGNVIGGGDWGEDRLVPDIMRAIRDGCDMIIRNPRSVRPWQHVLEPLSGYLLLAARLLDADGRAFAEGWNFGPELSQAVDVEALVHALTGRFADRDVQVRVAPDREAGPEAALLRLDSSKAAAKLGWRARLGLAEMMAMTADWYAADLGGATDMAAFSRAQLDLYRAAGSPIIEERVPICA